MNDVSLTHFFQVIQIVRPTLHDLDMWYFTDITLLQTLLPFNMTSAVGLAPYTVKPRDFEQKCLILVYAVSTFKITVDIFINALGEETNESIVKGYIIKVLFNI